MPHKISPMYTDGATVGITNFNTQGTKSWAFHYAQNSIKCSLEKNAEMIKFENILQLRWYEIWAYHEFNTIMAFKGKIFLPKNEALKHIILPLHTFFYKNQIMFRRNVKFGLNIHNALNNISRIALKISWIVW